MTGSVDVTALRMALGISQPQGEILHMLLESRVVSTAELLEAGVQYPRKDILSLRLKLGGFMPPIEIVSHRRLGYWIDPQDKNRLATICRQDDLANVEQE